MSAFICNTYHISLVAQKAYDEDLYIVHNGQRKRLNKSAEAIGKLLLKENARSCNHRYETNLKPRFKFDERAVEDSQTLSPEQWLGAVFCLEYQSCERPDWEQTEAYSILTALALTIAHRLSQGWAICVPEGDDE